MKNPKAPSLSICLSVGLGLLLSGPHKGFAAENLQSSPLTVFNWEAPDEGVRPISNSDSENTAGEAEAETLTIGLSPSGEAKKSFEERQHLLDLFRRSTKGEEGAQRKWERQDAGVKVLALAQILESGQEVYRRRAAKELPQELTTRLGAKEKDAARHALIRAALHDSVMEIREQAREAWLAIARGKDPDAGEAVREMGEGLDLKNPLEQRRVFDALKALGGGEVAEVLITKTVQRWGKGPRNHIMIARQRSYIADYDVSGAVFDPVIRSFLVGVVLDSQIMQIEMVHWLIEELQRMGAQEAVLKNPNAWQEFLKRQKEKAGLNR